MALSTGLNTELKFKVGDRVRSEQPYFLYTGTVIRLTETLVIVERDHVVCSEWECEVLKNGEVATAYGCWDHVSLLTHICEDVIKPKKPFMTSLNTMMKKLLDADTQALIKAGYLDSELELTEKGSEELETIQFQSHKAELVELAKSELAEVQ